MQTFSNQRIEDMLKKYELTQEEIEFIKCSQTPTTMDMNQSRIISELILAKTIEQSVNKMLKSNKELQESNDYHNNKIRMLTTALVFVGVVQAISAFIQIFH
jgi:uncharacterized membrane-anchored protein